MAHEWFRSADWNARAQEDFEQRLGRARPFNRSQYLRIKALALIDHGGKAEARGARELLVRVIENYPESGDVVMAHEHLGELDVREGRRTAAEAHYRAALRLAPKRNVYGDAALRLPELLIDDGCDATRSEASEVLDAIASRDLVFASQRFRYAVARARLARASGDKVEAGRYAESALTEAARDTPDFPRHPTVGQVDADRKVLREMRKLAGD
jgi:tetratricopeptide (TPR) repeat protein